VEYLNCLESGKRCRAVSRCKISPSPPALSHEGRGENSLRRRSTDWRQIKFAYVQALNPFRRGQSVRPELLDLPLILGVIKRPLRSELGGDGGIHQRAGVGGAHLHEDALIELAHGGP